MEELADFYGRSEKKRPMGFAYYHRGGDCKKCKKPKRTLFLWVDRNMLICQECKNNIIRGD